MTVYVTEKFKTKGIFIDEVTYQGMDRYKSTKFRCTYYSRADFYLSQEEAEKFIKGKYGF